MNNIALLANEPCRTGENPYYVASDRALYWVDIPRGTLFQPGLELPSGKLFRLDLVTMCHEVVYEGIPIGGFTRQENGDLLLFRVNDIARMKPDGSVESLIPFRDEGAKRFNDVIADPMGRVFAGTIGQNDASGGLYRVERDGTLELLFRGTGVSNGMGFSPDGGTFYWTDYTRSRIFRFVYRPESGQISDRELFYAAKLGDGHPDGMTVDSQGRIWSVHLGFGWILCLGADGREITRIKMPVRRLTSCTFGGRDGNTLFVTSGRQSGSSMPDDLPDGAGDGALWSVPGLATGRAEFASRILI